MTTNPTPASVNATPDELIKVIGHIRVLPDLKYRAASCVAISPDVFVLDEKMLVEFVNSQNPSSSELLLAAQSCPTAAIEIIDTQSGQKLWPLG
jgi:ferredoxin